MKSRISGAELLAVMTAAGVITTTASFAGETNAGKHPALKVADKTTSLGSGKENACGKGSCGTDEKGAKAAKDRDKKKATKKADKPATEDKSKTDKAKSSEH